MQRRKILTLLMILICHLVTQAQDFRAYKKALFIRGNDTLPYRILYPENYQSEKSYPLVMFLHGAGLRARDNESPLKEGANLFLQDSIRKKYPGLIGIPITLLTYGRTGQSLKRFDDAARNILDIPNIKASDTLFPGTYLLKRVWCLGCFRLQSNVQICRLQARQLSILEWKSYMVNA